MPHDANGVVLQEGDKVSLPCVLKRIDNEGPDCNVTIEAVHAMEGGYKPTVACNAKQIVKET